MVAFETATRSNRLNRRYLGRADPDQLTVRSNVCMNGLTARPAIG